MANTFEEMLNFLNPLTGYSKTSDAPDKACQVREQSHNNLTWVDVENPKRKQLSELAERYKLHPFHIQMSLVKGQLDQIDTEADYIFLLIRTPRQDEQKNRIITDQVCIFVGKNFIVTIHDDASVSLKQLFKQSQGHPELQQELFKKGSGYLLYKILEVFVADIAQELEITLKEVDEIEDLVFEVTTSGVYRISQLRQKLIRLRRVMNTFRLLTQDLATNSNDFTKSMPRYFKTIMHTVGRQWEILEEARDAVEIYKDADFTVSTERTNKILGILTIIFTLGIPATIMGSLYGMNVLLPGGIEAGSWTIWGPFTTFYSILGIAVAPAALMLIWFKYKKWF